MLSLSLSGLALATTSSQIESLLRDSNFLSKEIASLTSSSGRSYPRQFEDLMSGGAELIMELASFLQVVNF